MKTRQVVRVVVVAVMAVMATGCCCPRRVSSGHVTRVVRHSSPSYVTPVVIPAPDVGGLLPPQVVQTAQQATVLIQQQPAQSVPQPQAQAGGRVKLMLHLLCPSCQKYHTWKGGVLPPNTQLFFWHPEAKEWRLYGGDYTKIMRQPQVEEPECPNNHHGQ